MNAINHNIILGVYFHEKHSFNHYSASSTHDRLGLYLYVFCDMIFKAGNGF